MLTAGARGVQLGSLVGRHWTFAPLPLVRGAQVSALAADDQGRLHALIGPSLTYLRRELDGSWRARELLLTAESLAIAVSASGVPRLAYANSFEGIRVLFAPADPWSGTWQSVGAFGEPVYEGLQLVIDASDDTHLAFSYYQSAMHAVGGPDGFSVSALGEYSRAVLAPNSDGTLDAVSGLYWTKSELQRARLGSASAAEVLWLGNNPRFVIEGPAPSVARAPSGKLLVSHRVPEGLALLEETAAGYTDTLLEPQALPSALVLDGAGTPHLFYLVYMQNPRDRNASLYQWRHLFRGSCASE